MISFDPTEEQQMMRESVAGFARDELRPVARAVDEGGTIPASVAEKVAQLGLLRTWLPEQYGGDGADRSAVTGAMIVEELAWGDLALAAHLLSPRLFAFPILELGTASQRDRFLGHFAGSGFIAASAALTEPRFDFDLASLSTRAVAKHGEWLLDGVKCFVPLAREAEFILVYAGAGSEVAAFIVPRETPGLEISEREKNMGLKGLATHEITLTACRLPAEARLGSDAASGVVRLTSEMRVATAAIAAGVARAAFEYARDYAKERKAFGAPIATKQAIAFMLAEMAIEVDAMRLLAWEAGWHLDRGEDAAIESYLAKQYAAAAALKVTDNAVQVLGGHGYIREHPVELWLRNARGLAALDAIAIV
ncbi:MAG: acyl-CoA dehydrogenase family protein [Candidatus Binataceae bacterium]|nr:acyl-CoA dehydrogenase family protein [Candidatus Binataceae bacterium]